MVSSRPEAGWQAGPGEWRVTQGIYDPQRGVLKMTRPRRSLLVGPDGLLNRLTKNVLETALEAEMDEHLGYEKHDVSGRGSGNSRNGTRTKTVLTEIGPVEIDVPRDTGSTFDPQIVKKRQRRLTGVWRQGLQGHHLADH
jgi:transposase-like protein